MQLFGPQQSDRGTTYSASDIEAMFKASVVKESWSWDQLDQAGDIVGDLTPFVEIDQSPPVITYDTTQAVKRSMTMTLNGRVPLYKNGILSLDSQIRGHYKLLAPDGGYLTWPIGTFVVLPAGGKIGTDRVHHTISATDYGQLLLDYTFERATSVQPGSAIVAIGSLLSIPGARTAISMVIPDLQRSLALPITWDKGVTRLKAINDILAAINYFPAWFDEMGIMRSSPIPDWNTVSAVYKFDATRKGSILLVPFSQTVDWSAVGNVQTVNVEDPRRGTISATYTNDNPLSPVSTMKYHPKSLPVHEDSNIADVNTAYLVAKTLVQTAARLFQVWQMSTFAWPFSQDQDVYEVLYNDPDDGAKDITMIETGWSMTCKAGQGTAHTLNEVVAA